MDLLRSILVLENFQEVFAVESNDLGHATSSHIVAGLSVHKVVPRSPQGFIVQIQNRRVLALVLILHH